MIRTIGACLILGVSGGFGLAKSIGFRRQSRQLRQLITLLELLRCELNYTLLPLPLHRGGGAVPAALRAGAGALRQPSQGRRAGTDGDKGTLPAGGRAAGALGAAGIAGAL